MARRGRLHPGLLALAGVFLTTVSFAGPPPRRIKGDLPIAGRVGTAVPERTDAGVWEGTWYYVYRDGWMALWIRPGGDGKPEVKLRYQSLATSEAFETDWNGRATYYLAGQPATFELSLDERTDTTIRGRWRWDVQFEDSGRTETGRFQMYRAADGRQLVLRFDEWELVIRRRDQIKRYSRPPAWTFVKASKRLVLWDEIPF
jgi:hypothetical protein